MNGLISLKLMFGKYLNKSCSHPNARILNGFQTFLVNQEVADQNYGQINQRKYVIVDLPSHKNPVLIKPHKYSVQWWQFTGRVKVFFVKECPWWSVITAVLMVLTAFSPRPAQYASFVDIVDNMLQATSLHQPIIRCEKQLSISGCPSVGLAQKFLVKCWFVIFSILQLVTYFFFLKTGDAFASILVQSKCYSNVSKLVLIK